MIKTILFLVLFGFLLCKFFQFIHTGKCPRCGGKMTADMYNIEKDSLVWECQECGEKFT